MWLQCKNGNSEENAKNKIWEKNTTEYGKYGKADFKGNYFATIVKFCNNGEQRPFLNHT